MSWSSNLGPFVLEYPIGRGGMGEVWLAHHRVDGVPVAIKVLTHGGAGDDRFIAAFRDEVRAVAALDHPSIVRVYDYGMVPDPPPRDPAGNHLPANSPYLAMELMNGGTLDDVCGRASWREIQTILLGLLDALAHAHARGVTHRDLKPANILLGSELEDLRLVDFGLAHAARGQEIGPNAPERKVRGTPAYMAPEQWRGQWRASGPWTDLYAVGCLGWALTTGEPPFGRKGTPQRFAEAHCYEELPPLRSAVEVPYGFESWLRRLLDKSTEYRFRRAADAAWSLQDLYAPSSPPDTAFPATPSQATLSIVQPISAGPSQSGIEGWTSVSHTLVLEPSASQPDGWTRVRTAWLMDRDDSELSPIPANWRRPSDMEHPARLTGVGLGLYGLRSIPLVDREPQRDALWSELRDVRATSRARGVILRGPAGSGKSRLAQWLCERAHELGAVGVLRALHSPIPGPVNGLGPMVARSLACTGLDRQQAFAHLEEMAQGPGGISPADVLPLVNLVAPDIDAKGLSGNSLPDAAEVHLLVERLCGARTRDRCLILWLDDVQWGWEALGLARHLLAGNGIELPVLVVMTIREDALDEQPAEASRVSQLAKLPTTTEHTIEALPKVHQRAMVDALLGLETELACRVQLRTAGNPLFAVQLVGDWVERGLLEPGDDGFRLVQGANATAFPDSLHEIWLRRLDRLLRERPDTDLVALEIAAALGLQIARDDWHVACIQADANPSPGLVDALLSQRLARREGGVAGADWAFVHGMLRESLERRAREAGRWPLHNWACAKMLEGTSGLRVPERMGRHLLAADRVLDALPALAEGARLRLASGDYPVAALLLEQREAAMRELPVPDDDPAWAVGWIHRARLERVTGDADRAIEYSNRASRIATQTHDPALQARALEEVGWITNLTGEPLQAAAVMAAACSLADQAEDRRLGGQCRQARAEFLLQSGSLDEADAELRVALASFEAIGDLIGASRCKLGLGSVARARGDYAQGRVWLHEAETLSAAAGTRIGVAQCKHSLGENHRASGDPGAAEGYYQEALKAFEALGSRDQVHCRINRALCLLALGRPDEARDALEVGLAQCLERRLVGVRAAVHVFLLPCFVADNRWSAWDEHLAQAEELLEGGSFTDVDVGLMARLAGQMAMQAGQRERAVRVLRLARAQWARLQRADELTGIELMLAHLQSA